MLNAERNTTLRCVAAAGAATTSVVATVVMLVVFVRPGVIVPETLSDHDAWTATAPAEPVMTCSLSRIDVRRIIITRLLSK